MNISKTEFVQQFGPEVLKNQPTFIENELCDRNTIRVMNENTEFENMFENNPLSLVHNKETIFPLVNLASSSRVTSIVIPGHVSVPSY